MSGVFEEPPCCIYDAFVIEERSVERHPRRFAPRWASSSLSSFATHSLPSRQAELAVVRLKYGVRLVLELVRDDDRAKDLLPHDPHVAVAVADDSRRPVVAVLQVLRQVLDRLAPGQYLASLLFAQLAELFHLLELALVDHGSHLRGGVLGGADADLRHLLHVSGDEVVVNVLLHKETRSGDAGLTGGNEAAEGSAVDCGERSDELV